MRATHGHPDEPTETHRRQPIERRGQAADRDLPALPATAVPEAGSRAVPGCGARWIAHHGSVSGSRPAAVSRL
jgi:hypothetical protein